MRVLDVTRWPGWLVFAAAGAVAVVFAFVTVNLFSHAMANARFIGEHGWTALRLGAFQQALELLFWGVLALVCWLAFKICDGELTGRYRAWTSRNPGRTAGADKTAASDQADGVNILRNDDSR